jgi:hypothetical protein
VVSYLRRNLGPDRSGFWNYVDLIQNIWLKATHWSPKSLNTFFYQKEIVMPLHRVDMSTFISPLIMCKTLKGAAFRVLLWGANLLHLDQIFLLFIITLYIFKCIYFTLVPTFVVASSNQVEKEGMCEQWKSNTPGVFILVVVTERWHLLYISGGHVPEG